MTTNNEHPFAQYVRILGKGKTGSRSLSFDEAENAMQMILRNDATSEQVGAFLMLLRVKEESAEEIAGFVNACRLFIDQRSSLNSSPNVDLDWSSYAGKSKQPNWYVLSMLLLASSGIRVFSHGARGHTVGRVYTHDVFEALNLPIAIDTSSAGDALEKFGLCYMPLDAFCAPMQALIHLRDQFGLRSPVHTLCRLLNPTRATATLQSVFHPSYIETHHRAAALLNEKNAMVIKGDSGEFELRPQAKLTVNLLRRGEPGQFHIQRSRTQKLEIALDIQHLKCVWEDSNILLTQDEHETAKAAAIGTAALALLCVQKAKNYEQAHQHAESLWQNRDRNLLNRFAQ